MVCAESRKKWQSFTSDIETTISIEEAYAGLRSALAKPQVLVSLPGHFVELRMKVQLLRMGRQPIPLILNSIFFILSP